MSIEIEKKKKNTLHVALGGLCMSIQLCGNRLYTYAHLYLSRK